MSTPPITVPGPIEPARTALNPVYAASVAFIVLDTLFVVARFVSRIFIGKVRLGWDDCWILVAWLLTVALTAPFVYSTVELDINVLTFCLGLSVSESAPLEAVLLCR